MWIGDPVTDVMSIALCRDALYVGLSEVGKVFPCLCVVDSSRRSGGSCIGALSSSPLMALGI